MKGSQKTEKSVEQLFAEAEALLTDIELFQLPKIESQLKIIRETCKMTDELVSTIWVRISHQQLEDLEK